VGKRHSGGTVVLVRLAMFAGQGVEVFQEGHGRPRALDGILIAPFAISRQPDTPLVGRREGRLRGGRWHRAWMVNDLNGLLTGQRPEARRWSETEQAFAKPPKLREHAHALLSVEPKSAVLRMFTSRCTVLIERAETYKASSMLKFNDFMMNGGVGVFLSWISTRSTVHVLHMYCILYIIRM